jgi:hypothetical protein
MTRHLTLVISHPALLKSEQAGAAPDRRRATPRPVLLPGGALAAPAAGPFPCAGSAAGENFWGDSAA